MNTVVRASNSFSAGKKLYSNLSNFFTNHVENFYMTVQNVETKGLTHFSIDEKRNDDTNDKIVDFKIVRLEGGFPDDLQKKLIEKIEIIDQKGGKHKSKKYDDDSDSDSSSSSESDYYKIPKQPINRFTYFMLPYYKLNLVGLSPLDISRIYLPTFNLPINPIIEVRFDLYKLF